MLTQADPLPTPWACSNHHRRLHLRPRAARLLVRHRAALPRSHRRHHLHDVHHQQPRSHDGHRHRPVPRTAATLLRHSQRESCRSRRLVARPFASSATTLGQPVSNPLGLTNAFLDSLTSQPRHRRPRHHSHRPLRRNRRLAALADALNTCATTTCSPSAAATPPSSAAPHRHLHRGAQHRAQPRPERSGDLRHHPHHPTLRHHR